MSEQLNKFSKLVGLISSKRVEIDEIFVSGNEYYFKFRNKTFSIRKDKEGDFVLFAYPKWSLELGLLTSYIEEGMSSGDANYVAVDVEKFNAMERGELGNLYDWLSAKESGLDTLFTDLGI